VRSSEKIQSPEVGSGIGARRCESKSQGIREVAVGQLLGPGMG